MVFMFFKGFWVIYVVGITTGSISNKMILKFVIQIIKPFYGLE